MKTALYITILLFSMSTFAQKPNAKKMKPKFNSAQQAELQTKRMVLALDLSQKQQEQVQALELKKNKDREANRSQREARQKTGERPSQDELFAINSKRLDAQMAHQKEMQKILSEEQYKKWKELQKERIQRMEKRKAHNKMNQKDSRKP